MAFAHNFSSTVFQQKSTDARFTKVTWQEIQPDSTLSNTKTISFTIPRYSSPNLLLVNEMTLRVNASLTINDKETQIPQEKDCSVVNNVLHSLFSQCKVYVENVQTSENSENYPYKAIIIDALSYTSDAKCSFMEAAGFYQEDPFAHGAIPDEGVVNRKHRFQRYAKTGRTTFDWIYTTQEACFIGRLHTDLSSIDGGILPNVEIKVVLERSSDDFVLLAKSNDNFKLNLTQASLYIPVATLNSKLYNQITRKLEEQPASIYYTRSQVIPCHIPLGSTYWFSQDLFSPKQLPSRMVLGFIPTKHFRGTKLTNPFKFLRKWTFEARDLPYFARGLMSLNSDSPDEEVEAREFSTFVQRVYVTINGKSVDEWDTTATKLDDTMNFYRMHSIMGFCKSREGNDVTERNFQLGKYLLCYDLTKALNADTDLLLPSVKNGSLRVAVQFNESIPIELQMICYAEFPSVMTIDSYGRVHCSFK